jgi:hypothetical protein
MTRPERPRHFSASLAMANFGTLGQFTRLDSGVMLCRNSSKAAYEVIRKGEANSLRTATTG